MAIHKASCQCGALSLEAREDPYITICCNCDACQNRTGSAFATVAYFKKDVLDLRGEPREWARGTASGRSLRHYFCQTCGTTLYWTLDMRPDSAGVLIGAFDTPKREPVRTVWRQDKLDWVALPDHWEAFDQGSRQPTN